MGENYFDKIIQAASQIQSMEYTGYFSEIYMNPKDYKRLHIDKVSIRFIEKIKRNRKLRNNGKTT